MNHNKNIVVLGASSNPSKYSYQAVSLLSEKGYTVFPVHPSGFDVANHKTCKALSEIKEKIHTLSVYVNAKISSSMKDEILELSPARIIFNPGAENNALADACNRLGIQTENACTLVLLRTNSF
jgi:uncharacterized protein